MIGYNLPIKRECRDAVSAAPGVAPRRVRSTMRFKSIPPLTPEQIERFWSKVDKSAGPTACWPWKDGLKPDGYALFKVRAGDSYMAHRIAYTLVIGQIPDGMTVDHVKAWGCELRHCANPAHLEPVPHEINCNRRRGQYCARGHELTEDNLYLRRDGGRRCKTCSRNNGMAWHRRKMAAQSPREPITHCKHGHEYTPENTRLTAQGGRWCVICSRSRNKGRVRRGN